MTVTPALLMILCPLIFLAGFVDSIAGGGGLISLTSYMACGMPAPLALGTNKFSAIVGGTFASANYIKTKNYDIQTLIGAVVAALLGSWIGAYCSMKIDDSVFSIILLIATPVVLLLVILDKNYSSREDKHGSVTKILICVGIGLVVGFYDGFYGPGAGMFMQMGFIMLAGLSVKKACGNARMVNWASNCGSLVNFLIAGNVLFEVAVPCAVCSVVGNILGSRLAIKKDVKIVKPVMITVVILLFIKVLADHIL